MKSGASTYSSPHESRVFYGWYIVAVGFLSHMVCAFHMSSTLSVFLKPLTEDLAVSRGLFSMMRSGEIVIGALMAPFVGPLVDRYGGRWLMASGALVTGLGFVLLAYVSAFWQFLLLRWTLVTIGGVFMCHMVVTVTISRWFVRKRGRAIAIASLGQGSSKVAIPFFTAMLFAVVGWRQTWAIFGLITLLLVVIPALIFMRRSPEDMGLKPDGMDETIRNPAADSVEADRRSERSAPDEVEWSRKEVLQSSAFWLICFTYGMANVGIAGLNLHVFAYVLDAGHPTMVAATVLSIIALTQLGSTLFWGFITEKIDIRRATMLKFLTQGLGLGIAVGSTHIASVYAGFFSTGLALAEVGFCRN